MRVKQRERSGCFEFVCENDDPVHPPTGFACGWIGGWWVVLLLAVLRHPQMWPLVNV
jgi:hypothetical protein